MKLKILNLGGRNLFEEINENYKGDEFYIFIGSKRFQIKEEGDTLLILKVDDNGRDQIVINPIHSNRIIIS